MAGKEGFTSFAKVIEGLLKAAEKSGASGVPPNTKETPDSIKMLEKRSKEIMTAERKKKEAEQAQKTIEEARRKGQHVTASMREWAEKNKLPFDPKQPEEAQLQTSKNRLQVALAASKISIQELGLTSVEGIINPQVAEYYARISLLPSDLKNNPYVRTQELMRLVCSTSADQPQESQKQLLTVAKRETAAIKKLREEYNHSLGLNKAQERRFDLRDEEIDQLFTEKGMGATPTPGRFKVYDEVTELQDVAIDFTAHDRTQVENLRTLLKDYNYQLELLVPTPEVEEKLLNDFQKELARGTYKKLVGTKDQTVAIDRELAKSFINRIKARIEEVKQLVEAERLEPKVRYPDASKTPGAGPDKTWLTLKLEPPHDPAGNIVPILDEKLASLIEELGVHGQTGDLRQLAQREMDVRVLSTKLMGTDREWAEAVSRRAQEIFHKMKGNRFELDPNLVVAMTEGLSAAAVRDREFYKRIIKILENPNEESRHQMNLYDQADWDTFIEVVKGVKNIDPKTGKRIGLMLADHYHNLFQTVTELSNMEYWGNHASGDVENLSKAANFMQNQFAIEAYSDLHVEDMMQCYEMAIKVLRDSDGQWIDPSLAVFDPKSYNNFLDQLTIQFFKTRVQLGAVRDYVRDPVTGIPERSLDETGGRTLKRSDKSYEFEADEETRELRMLCSLRLAKGAYVLNNRAPELFAFTRTPGVDMEGYENKIPIFSSKVMGGLSRWDNPMSEWLLMYGFGDVLHKDFFNQLLGAHGSPEGRALTWSLDESIEAVDMLSSGDSEKFKARFGDNATRVLDMIEDFSFSGRHGPLSMWGTIDTTLNWTSKEYERLGGSIRISMVPVWVEKILKPEFEAAHKKNNWGKTHMGDQWYNATLGEGGWGEHNKWKERYDKYTRIYKTWIWTQTIMRNSTGVASHVWVDYKANDGMHHGKLRSKIFREIFTAEDLRDFKIEGQTVPELVVERDVASTGAMTEDKKDLLMRISIVDGDVGAVQRYAMNIGKQPENVTEVDFKACIKDDDNIKLFAGGKEVVITGKRRREQATDFWKKVQREMLGKAIGDTSGGWDFNDWHRELNPNWGGKKGEEISFGNTEQIDEIFNKARVASKNAHVEHRLTEDFVDKKIQIHFGTEDTQWSYLDMSSLGPRQWGRRWGDKLTRAKTTSLGLKHFDLIVGKPKMEDLIKSLQEMGTSEKGHDPKEAAKFAYVFGVATHNMYKQSLLAGFPLVGRLLPSLGIPMSIVQKRLGTDSGTYWSINNTLEFSEKLGETRVIPEKRIIAGRDFGPYTMERLRKDIGASKILAATEMFIIGYVIAAALTSLLAVKEGIEEDTGKRH